MDDRVLDLFEDYAVARARGDRPDPRDYLARAGEGAEDLAALIEGLATGAPPPAPTAEVVAMMGALVADEPPLLGVRLQHRMTVDALVDRLAERFRLQDRREKLKRLYQRLEGGLIDARRIDPRLAEEIAEALGIRARDVALAARPPSAAEPLFARDLEGVLAAEGVQVADTAGEPDDLDRLFGLG